MKESIESLRARPCHACDRFSHGFHPFDDGCAIHGRWTDFQRVHCCHGGDFVPRKTLVEQVEALGLAWRAFAQAIARSLGLVRLLDWLAAKLRREP